MHTPPRARRRACALSSAAALVLASAASGQSNGGAPSGVSIAHGMVSAAGEADSPGFALASGLAQGAAGPSAASPNFQLRTGVTWVAPAVTTDHPIVFGVAEGRGSAAGGELVSVYGFNFEAPGAGTNAVDFGGSPSSGTVAISNTELRTLTPAGVDANANPLAATAVEVTNALGTHTAAGAFVYEPAITLVDPARIGGEIRIRLFSAPGSFAFVLFGQSLPGTTIPVPPYDGSLELLLGLQILTPLLPLPGGQLVLTQPIADKPGLVGVVLELQTLSFDDFTLATGSFSNRLPITIQP